MVMALSVWNQGTVPTKFVLGVEKPLNEHFELSSIFVELEVLDVCLTVFQTSICKDVGAIWKVGPQQ